MSLENCELKNAFQSFYFRFQIPTNNIEWIHTVVIHMYMYNIQPHPLFSMYFSAVGWGNVVGTRPLTRENAATTSSVCCPLGTRRATAEYLTPTWLGMDWEATNTTTTDNFVCRELGLSLILSLIKWVVILTIITS
jgi:hypothetical protein